MKSPSEAVEIKIEEIVENGSGVGKKDWVKMVSLGVLVIQNASAVLLMRWTRTKGKGEVPFHVATTVVASEVAKLTACLAIVLATSGFDLQKTSFSLRQGLIEERWQVVKLLIPAILYTLQNNLLFVALENLEATMFQVTYQLKLLLTALFSVVLLNRKLTSSKWAALFMLFFGVVLTQIPESETTKVHQQGDWAVGFIACLICGTSSGFASVYFEKVLKRRGESSIWMRNIQLGASSLPCSIIAMVFTRSEPYPFFEGYTSYVYLLVAIQAGGGLLVAVVIKYADNILKGFATALAILLSGLVSALFLDFTPTTTFLSGATIVICSTVFYSIG